MSEKLTDSRRAALRDRGIFPRSSDLSILFATLGAVVGYRSISLDFGHAFELNQILYLSLVIPLGAAIGSVLATLVQSRFLFGFSFLKQKQERSFSQFFYSLTKLILCLGVGGLVFRITSTAAAEGSLKIQSMLGFATSSFLGLLVLFGLVGLLVSKFTFVERYQMSKSEIEADAREGEMRPEVKAAMDTNNRD